MSLPGFGTLSQKVGLKTPKYAEKQQIMSLTWPSVSEVVGSIPPGGTWYLVRIPL